MAFQLTLILKIIGSWLYGTGWITQSTTGNRFTFPSQHCLLVWSASLSDILGRSQSVLVTYSYKIIPTSPLQCTSDLGSHPQQLSLNEGLRRGEECWLLWSPLQVTLWFLQDWSERKWSESLCLPGFWTLATGASVTTAVVLSWSTYVCS